MKLVKHEFRYLANDSLKLLAIFLKTQKCAQRVLRGRGGSGQIGLNLFLLDKSNCGEIIMMIKFINVPHSLTF